MIPSTHWAVGLLAYLLLSQASPAWDSFSGRCVGVTDGNTIKVLRDGSEARVRLEGIDGPESGEPFSAKAKKFTSREEAIKAGYKPLQPIAPT